MSIKEFAQTTLLAATIGAGPIANVSAQESKQQQHSPEELVDALHSAFGKHKARAVHAKGIILEGEFIPAESAATITQASHLQKQPSKVLVRFSDFTGIPDIPDNNGAANPRGLGIKFIMPDGSTTDIVSHSFNGFPTATSDEFRDLLLAIGASGAGAAKPTALDKFLETHPIAKTFLTTQHLPASFSTINYFGVNSFKFTNQQGSSKYIRYQFISEAGDHFLTPEQFTQAGAEYLFEEIQKRITLGDIRFKLYAQIAEDGDKIEDPSIAWPDTRRKVLLGEININKLADNSVQQDKQFVINPGNILTGIEIADPMLALRLKAYPVSVKERQ